MGGVRVFVLILVLGGWGGGVYFIESYWYVLKWVVDSLKYVDNLMNCIFCNF